ncbi:MAG: signal peptide peptidase SppA [Treponema sp.]|nr:signal peptide peptidase SppA [Treponema sp.]
MAKKIAHILLEGVIQKENEKYNQKWLLETISELKKDKHTAGILLYINSPGGSVFESDEVYVALKKYKEETKKPVWAYFGALAASGGYYIGCAADKIIANRNTLTGSIGVIAGRFVDLTELMAKHGIKSETIHAGRNKTMGSFDQPVTEEQRAIMQSVADECYGQFTALVAENRRLELEAVTSLADGRIYTAQQAKALGLVDEIATFDEAVDMLKTELFGSKDAKVEVKKYELKKKRSLIKVLKGAAAGVGGTEALALARLIQKKQLPFPAYYYDQGLTDE